MDPNEATRLYNLGLQKKEERKNTEALILFEKAAALSHRQAAYEIGHFSELNRYLGRDRLGDRY